ncbi:MAG: PilZ domain-containing protein [Candidatus Latescibacterota bacterium]|nr:PilZ domain-containing protein [Candidatus Latescibacterota bacterium]
MATALFASTLAANTYLGIDDPDMRFVYGLFAAIVGVAVLMVVFRGMAKIRENYQLRKSSWRIFEKVAKVRGLSQLEIQVITSVVRKAKVKRPSQALGSITLYDRIADQALDRGWVPEDDSSLLDTAREKLVRANQKWDGHTNRRELERTPCTFEIESVIVTKDSVDEELKTSYQFTDEKFLETLTSLVEDGRSELGRIIDLSAGGLALLVQDKDQAHESDFITFSPGADPMPFDISGMHGRILRLERMEDREQLIVHVSFLPYNQDVRRQVIQVVYDGVEAAKAASRNTDKTAPAKKKTTAKKGAVREAAVSAKAGTKSKVKVESKATRPVPPPQEGG